MPPKPAGPNVPLDTFVASGHLSIRGERWKLRERWPWPSSEDAPRAR